MTLKAPAWQASLTIQLGDNVSLIKDVALTGNQKDGLDLN